MGTGSQTIRVAPPGSTIIRAASGAHTLTPGSKQIITVHKAASVAQGGGTGQPQIVTLVKTSQGMTVATVSLLTYQHHFKDLGCSVLSQKSF